MDLRENIKRYYYDIISEVVGRQSHDIMVELFVEERTGVHLTDETITEIFTPMDPEIGNGNITITQDILDELCTPMEDETEKNGLNSDLPDGEDPNKPMDNENGGKNTEEKEGVAKSSALEIHVEETIGRDSELKQSQDVLTPEVKEDLLNPMVCDGKVEKENPTFLEEFLYDINVSEDGKNNPKEENTTLKNDDELKKFVKGMRSKSTLIKTEQIVRRFQDWLESEQKETHNIDTMEPKRLNNYLANFLLNIRKANGEEYEPDTLTSYHRGIER